LNPNFVNGTTHAIVQRDRRFWGMPANTDEDVAELLKPMLKKRLFAALSKAIAPPADLLPFVAEQLAYMNRLESSGKHLASGPFVQEEVQVGDGLKILQIKTIEDGNSVTQIEPLIRRGFRQFGLRPWELREDRYDGRVECRNQQFFD
jgi:uncharacterized protein YciI